MLGAWYVEEWREKRLRFMNRLYDATGSSQLASVDQYELGDELGLSREETDRVIEYLQGELLAHAGLGGVGITHLGVLEVERALSNPKQETEHFPLPSTSSTLARCTDRRSSRERSKASSVDSS